MRASDVRPYRKEKFRLRDRGPRRCEDQTAAWAGNGAAACHPRLSADIGPWTAMPSGEQMQRRDRNPPRCRSEDVVQSSCRASKSAWLAPSVFWHLGSAAVVPPVSLKLGRLRRKAPSYRG